MKQLVWFGCALVAVAGCAVEDAAVATATDASFAYSPMGFARVTAAGAVVVASTENSGPAPVAFNSSGGAVTPVRTGVGTYTVGFAGLAAPAGAGQGGNVQVAAEGGSNVRCRVASWNSAGVSISVQCEQPSGALADSAFAVLFVRQPMPAVNSLPTSAAYAWIDPIGRAPLAYNYNSSGQANTAARIAGRTVVHVPGAISGNASILVSTYAGAAICGVASWGTALGGGVDITVDCRTNTNAQVFSAFTVSYATSGPAPGQQSAHTWFNGSSAEPGLTAALGKVAGCSPTSVSVVPAGPVTNIIVDGDFGAWDGSAFLRVSFAPGYAIGSYCKVETLSVTRVVGVPRAITAIRCYDATGAVIAAPWFPFTHLTSDASGPC
jgi:hypothetical protein